MIGMISRTRLAEAVGRWRPTPASGATGLVMRRIAPYLVGVIAAAASLAALMPRPATGAPKHTVDYVIVAGAPGLRWDDLNPTDTPTMWRLAQEGAIGALSIRSATQPTCPVDGWLTLGAGNYARAGESSVESVCPVVNTKLRTPDGIGAFLPDQSVVVRYNQRLPWGAQPGALAESMRCTEAVGPGAALAAARPLGRVDRYSATLPTDLAGALASCVLSIVDIGTVAGVGAARQIAARAADATLARLAYARPQRSLLLVAGLADTDTESRLHVAIAHGTGYAGGWLTSSSTSRSGYLQLIDLAPTALAALGRPAPPKLFVGAPAVRTAGRPADLTAAVGRLADADHEASAQRRVAGRFFTVLAIVQLALFALMVPVLRRARRPAGPVVARPLAGWLVRCAEVLLIAAALTVPAALVADLVPWWRFGSPGLVFLAVTAVALAGSTAVVVLSPVGGRTLGPLGGVAAVAAAAVALDVLTGARLQLNGVAGYSALAGSRYAGMGTVGLGVFIAGALLAAGCLAQQVRRRWRPVVVSVVGGVGVVLVGSPYLGADGGGAVALIAGVCLAAVLSTGGWLTFARLAWAVLAGLGVTTGFALLDLRHPVERRGGLGRFLGQISDGTGSLVVHRTGADNIVTLATSPLTLLALGAAVFVGFVLLRPWGGLKRLFGLFPPVRGALAGLTAATVLAGMIEGAGFNVTGAALATALPLAALAALRVLAHADDRTQPRPPQLPAAPTPPEPAGPPAGEPGRVAATVPAAPVEPALVAGAAEPTGAS
jgi:hypothetical protein